MVYIILLRKCLIDANKKLRIHWLVQMLMKGLEKWDIFLAIVRSSMVHACFAKSVFLFFFFLFLNLSTST